MGSCWGCPGHFFERFEGLLWTSWGHLGVRKGSRQEEEFGRAKRTLPNFDLKHVSQNELKNENFYDLAFAISAAD